MNIGTSIDDIEAVHNNVLSNAKLIPKQNIPSNKSPVKTQYSSGLENPTKLGVINAAASQVADKLIEREDKVLTRALSSFGDSIITNNLTKNNSFVNCGVHKKLRLPAGEAGPQEFVNGASSKNDVHKIARSYKFVKAKEG